MFSDPFQSEDLGLRQFLLDIDLGARILMFRKYLGFSAGDGRERGKTYVDGSPAQVPGQVSSYVFRFQGADVRF